MIKLFIDTQGQKYMKSKFRFEKYHDIANWISKISNQILEIEWVLIGTLSDFENSTIFIYEND